MAAPAYAYFMDLFYEYQPKFVAKIPFLFYPTKYFPQIMMIFIEIYSQIRIFSELKSKILA